MGFVNWSNVISGTIEAVPGFPRGQLWALFSALVQQRKALGEGHVVNMKGFAAANQKSRTILHRISVEESVFSRNLSFEMAWNTYACGAQFFLQRNGLFKPVLTNWNQWQTGLGEVLGIRGIAGLKTNKNDDIIIDLCTSNSSPGDNNAIKPALAEDVTLFSNQCPASADQSFLSMNVNFGIEYDNNTVQHRKLQETSLDRYRISQANPNPADSGFYPSEANDSMSISPSEEHKIQMRGYQTARLIFSGKMTRICYKPIMPKVVSIGGKPAIQRGKPKFHVYVETISDTTPIYGATWYIEYNLNSIPEGEFFDTIQTNIKPEAFANATILTSRPQ